MRTTHNFLHPHTQLEYTRGEAARSGRPCYRHAACQTLHQERSDGMPERRASSMDFSLKDLRAFAVRNRVDVTFHARATNAAWMVNRRGLVARSSIGDSTLAGVEETLDAA